MTGSSQAKRPKLAQSTHPAPEQPGDTSNPSSFFSQVENENKTAAYFGLQHTGSLRRLAVSYPVLQAFIAFDSLSTNARVHNSLVMLADSIDPFKDVKDVRNKWPLGREVKPADLAHNKAACIATILVKLKQQIDCMAESTPEVNQKRQDEAHQTFSTLFTKLQVANIQHKDQPIEIELGPLSLESTVEPYNRCYVLLKYFQHQVRSSKNVKNLGDSQGLAKGFAVKAENIPGWMRPQAPGAETIPVHNAVTAADKLSKKSFVALWHSKFNADDLNDSLGEEIERPNTKQTLTTDPRLFETGMGFRDQIRRQFSCVELHMNIHKCRLEYKSDGADLNADMEQCDWDEIKGILNSDENSDFVFKVGFYPLVEGEDAVFETDEHPNFAGYFVSASDADGGASLVQDNLALEEKAAALEAQAGGASGKDAASAVNNSDNDALMRFLDQSMNPGAEPHDIGEAPDPLRKFAGNREELMKYFDGRDVTNAQELRQWQRVILDKISRAVPISQSYDKPKKGILSKDAEKSIEDAHFYGTMAAEARERKDDDEAHQEADAQARQKELEENEQYYVLRSSYSGTKAQTGPPLDLCLDLLGCEKQEDGLYKSLVLEGATTCNFYHYQISGVVGVMLKLYGKIDVDRLLAKTPRPFKFDEQKVRRAAEVLHDLQMHGCLLCDDVGFGKTMQGLLATYLNQLLNHDPNPDHPSEVLHRPSLLVVPSSLVHSWIMEIRANWPCFNLLISFEDHAFKKSMGMKTLKRSHLADFPRSIPEHLSWAFNQRNPTARRALIITSYETHKARTVQRVLTLNKPGQQHDPPRRKPDGTTDWKVKPSYTVNWNTKFSGVFGFLVADEAQKVKNFNSGLSAALYCQNIPKKVLMTATPFHNHVRDLLGLTHLIATQARAELESFLKQNPPEADRLKKIQEGNTPFAELDSLARTDPLRLWTINARLLMPVVNADIDYIHKSVMRKLKPVLETVMIRRSASSELPVTEGEPQSLRGMFKKIIRKTVLISRTAEDELEYQMWHKEAAGDFSDQLTKRKAEQDAPPGQPVPVVKPPPFSLPTIPLRKLSLANFSTKMARLDATMEKFDGDTHVATLQKWRDAGKEADFLVEMTRGGGESRPETAAEVAQFLAKGCPTMSLVCREVLAARIIEPVDPKKHKQHQKLIIGESTPANAYWIQSNLRALQIDARILHAGLSNKAKADMVDLFNDPNSTLRVLIMMYDVGAYGLNLNRSCDRILITAIARSFALEEQLCGRTNRITSIFNTIVVRRFIPNSHDIFRSSAQADKATVQLATNAQDPKIRQLMIEQLQKLQTEVDECHESEAGKALKKLIVQHKSLVEAEERKHLVEDQGRQADRLSSLRPRAGKPRSSYNDFCNRCEENISSTEGYICEKCSETGHAECQGLDEGAPTGTTFICKACVATGTLGQLDDSLLTQGGAMVFTDPDEADAYIDPADEAEESTGRYGRSFQQQRAEEQFFDDDFDFNLILGSEDLASFASATQPNDDDRKRLVLLSLETGKVWEDKDLDHEKYLRLGLLLLFNMIQGKSDLATSRSIHINYTQFSKAARDSVKKAMNVTKAMEKEQKRWVKKR